MLTPLPFITYNQMLIRTTEHVQEIIVIQLQKPYVKFSPYFPNMSCLKDAEILQPVSDSLRAGLYGFWTPEKRKFSPVHTLFVGLLATSQYPEGPATGHLDTGFSWFPCVYKRMLRWFPTFQVATTCFSCSPPDLSFLDPYFIFMYMHNNYCHRVTARFHLNILLLLLLLLLLYDMYVSCHRPFLPGTSLEPAVIPTAQASSFTLQYFPYYVWCSKYSCLL